jgi:hypothetical protein
MIASFKYRHNSSFCPCTRKYCWVRLKLIICLRVGIKMLEQHLLIKPGISSGPTLDDFADIRIGNGSKG